MGDEATGERGRGTARQRRDYGYGIACDVSGKPLKEELVMIAANQEHGILAATSGRLVSPQDRFPIGTRLRILPNHACATGAQHPAYMVLSASGADRPLERWERFYGW